MMTILPHEPLWNHIYSLVVLGECGSYTAAAERLGVTKGAMSQRIAELERLAGVALVQRTTRSVRLTEAGQRLVDTSKDAFDGIEKNFLEVIDSASTPRGLIRMTAPVALGRQQLVPRLPAFLQRHPDIRIELELSDQLTPLAQQGFDLAIRHASAAPDTHVAWTLCQTRALLVASKSYLRKRGVPAVPEDLQAHDCLHYFRRGEQPGWNFIHGGQDGQRKHIEPRGPFAANNSEALREAALGGLGIALMPDFSAIADLERGKLVLVLPHWQPVDAFGDRLFAIRPYSPYVPLAVKVFVEYLREQFKAGF
jgi:DNA-binding transcriptional LysR family regulator